MPEKRYLFTVEGKGEFPFDMLRHDRCWPASNVGGDNIVNLAPSRFSDLVDETRQVTLVGLSEPTKDRWRSFRGGWRVIEVQEIRP